MVAALLQMPPRPSPEPLDLEGFTRGDWALVIACVAVIGFFFLFGDKVARMRFWYADRGRDLRRKYSRNRRSVPAVYWLAVKHGFFNVEERGGR